MLWSVLGSFPFFENENLKEYWVIYCTVTTVTITIFVWLCLVIIIKNPIPGLYKLELELSLFCLLMWGGLALFIEDPVTGSILQHPPPCTTLQPPPYTALQPTRFTTPTDPTLPPTTPPHPPPTIHNPCCFSPTSHHPFPTPTSLI